MHDIRFIRDNPDAFDAALRRRNLDPMAMKVILPVDKQWRATQTMMQDVQAHRNNLSKQVGDLKRKGENADALMQEVIELKEKMVRLEEHEKKLAEKLKNI